MADDFSKLLDAIEFFKFFKDSYSVKIYRLISPDLKRKIRELLD